MERSVCGHRPRDEPINDKEKALVEMYSQWVEYTMAYWDEPAFRETRTDTIEGRAVSSEAIDSMMDALKSRTRRVILMALLDTTGTSITTLERRLNQENDRIPLYHTHVPKLANAEYITWDNETDTISKGPKFSEVEPLVQLLKDYNTEFPSRRCGLTFRSILTENTPVINRFFSGQLFRTRMCLKERLSTKPFQPKYRSSIHRTKSRHTGSPSRQSTDAINEIRQRRENASCVG